jgi:phosphatidylglycerophosphate synthase
MPKLSDEDKFVDFSDYGRPLATYLAYHFSKKNINAIQVTVLFLISGVLCAYCIYMNQLVWGAIFLMTKNILDAVDGEIARITNHPSLIGRYLDSIFDFVINFLIFITVLTVESNSGTVFIWAFLGIEFQCSIYNYYYVIVRRRLNNAETSRIIEYQKPTAYPYESQKTVTILHTVFLCFYVIFDVLVLLLDKQALFVNNFPKWFMSLISLLGLGFQLLVICLFLCLGLTEMILPFFAYYSIFGLFVILIRKLFLK